MPAILIFFGGFLSNVEAWHYTFKYPGTVSFGILTHPTLVMTSYFHSKYHIKLPYLKNGL
jgi:hypothetical protein